MEKGDLKTNDGNKFEVFWLKSQDKPAEDSQPSCAGDVFEPSAFHGCCPVGPKGHKGVQGIKGKVTSAESETTEEEIHPLQQKFTSEKDDLLDKLIHEEQHAKIQEALEAEKDSYDIANDPLSKLFKMSFGKTLKKEVPLPVQIDDTIESDIVKEPVIGEIYRVKGINMAAKYVGKSPMGVDGQVLRQMRYHTYPFYLLDADNMLLKTSDFEKELYLNFKL